MVLSFVVPAFNEEAYLGDCLASILEQTAVLIATGGHSAEIVVVDNGSSDGTAEIALSYPGVQLVREPRKGLPFARQAGFLASRGDLVANVDADSRLTPGWVDFVLRTFAAQPGLAALSGPFVYYDLQPRQRRAVHLFYLVAWMTYAINRYILSVGSMLQGGNFICSRWALERIGGFDCRISFYGEDTDVARRLHRVGQVLFTFDLKMFSSARRLKHEGMFLTAARYSLNYFWTTFLKRPFTLRHLDIREPEQPSMHNAETLQVAPAKHQLLMRGEGEPEAAK